MSILKDRYQKGSPGHALHLGTSIIGVIGVAMVVQICYQYFYFSPSDNEGRPKKNGDVSRV